MASTMMLQDDVVADIFGFLGASETAKCSEVCQQWYRVCVASRCLWRQFVMDDYHGLLPLLDDGEQGDCHHEDADWRRVYAYLSKTQRSWEHQPGVRNLPLPDRVVFSDDGSPYPGFPAESALRGSHRAWCTSGGVDKDVDFVIELPQLCMVNAFVAGNGGRDYTAPLKEALVFTSIQPIDLEAARQYDGEEGSKWAKKLHRILNNSNKNSSSASGSRGGGGGGVEPLLGFCFPPPPKAFGFVMNRRLHRPVVARYIHFKLLSSYHPPGMFSTNIDVQHLLTFGSQLPELPLLLKQPNLKYPLPKDPSYQRMHQLRLR